MKKPYIKPLTEEHVVTEAYAIMDKSEGTIDDEGSLSNKATHFDEEDGLADPSAFSLWED